MRLLLVLALALCAAIARAQTAAPMPPLVYSYQGESAPSSLLQAISTAAAPYNSILANSASDTATGLVGAFPTTATVADTNSPVAATSSVIFKSGNPGEVLSSDTRAPYTKIGTVDTSMAKGTAGASATKSAGMRTFGAPGVEVFAALAAVAGGILTLCATMTG
uniref:FGENESH: predicted gene_3.553 protein n=1 Tax=Rhodotorula toruloides TaxID=5286 RepID=A0A0K3CGC1_RHOTO